MAPPAPSLRRLVRPAVGRLLDDTAAAVPELGVAIVGLDGEVVHTSGAWPAGQTGADGATRLDLVVRDEHIGWLTAAHHPPGDAPAPLLAVLARSISLLLGEELDKRDLAAEVLERYRELNVLYRSSETIGASLDAAEVPRLLLAETERVIPASVAAVLLGDAAVDGGQPVEVKGTPATVAALGEAARALVAAVVETGRPDIATWPATGKGTAAGDAVQSALGVPIRAGETVLGVVLLGRDAGARPFTAGDEKLLLGLASQAGIALERARLHEQEAQRHRLEEELEVARRIQLTLLPSAVPALPGWSFAAIYQAAREVGGDFYDFLDHRLGERRLGLVIGDVTGKGVPAALMMAYARAVLRTESIAGHSPKDVLARTNRMIMLERRARPFVSAFYAELDLDSGRLAYANAGHDAPLWLDAAGRACRELNGPGVILGAFHDIGLEAREIELAAGDTVVFYTDGVTEARDHAGRLFGDERLAEAVTGGRGNAEQVLESVTRAVADFTAGAAQADDLTIVVVQREGG